jgi:hypothetical protein
MKVKGVFSMLMMLLVGLGAFWAGAQDVANQRVNLWEQSLAEGPVRATDSVGSKVPDEDSLMFIKTVQIEFTSSGKLVVNTADFTTADSKGWRTPARAIRLDGPGNRGWAIPKPNCTINIERNVVRGDKLTLEIAFCANKEFDWESSELHMGVPLRAIAPPSSAEPRVIRANTIRIPSPQPNESPSG